MILKYESDVLDDENARGKFYHVCQGRIQETPLAVPPQTSRLSVRSVRLIWNKRILCLRNNEDGPDA